VLLRTPSFDVVLVFVFGVALGLFRMMVKKKAIFRIPAWWPSLTDLCRRSAGNEEYVPALLPYFMLPSLCHAPETCIPLAPVFTSMPKTKQKTHEFSHITNVNRHSGIAYTVICAHTSRTYVYRVMMGVYVYMLNEIINFMNY